MSWAKDKYCELLVTAGGLGYAPWAPGTFGTLAGIAIAGLIGTTWPDAYLPGVLGCAVVLLFLGAPVGEWAERRFGRKDPRQYVLDEVVGYLVAVAWPVFPGWTHLGVAFFLFRLTDVTKPPPARQLEKIPGGWGILVDDVVAGLWALAGIAALRWLFPDLLTP